MKMQFEEYLKTKGYKQTTPSGNPSTVYDYIKRIDRVCDDENMTWQELANNIEQIVSEYSSGGRKEEQGKISHSAVINALRRFHEFTQQN